MNAFNNDPIRVGIIGCSNIARKRFLPALIRSNKAKLQSIWTQSCRAQKWQPKHHVIFVFEHGFAGEGMQNPKSKGLFDKSLQPVFTSFQALRGSFQAKCKSLRLEKTNKDTQYLKDHPYASYLFFFMF